MLEEQCVAARDGGHRTQSGDRVDGRRDDAPTVDIEKGVCFAAVQKRREKIWPASVDERGAEIARLADRDAFHERSAKTRCGRRAECRAFRPELSAAIGEQDCARTIELAAEQDRPREAERFARGTDRRCEHSSRGLALTRDAAEGLRQASRERELFAPLAQLDVRAWPRGRPGIARRSRAQGQVRAGDLTRVKRGRACDRELDRAFGDEGGKRRFEGFVSASIVARDVRPNLMHRRMSNESPRRFFVDEEHFGGGAQSVVLARGYEPQTDDAADGRPASPGRALARSEGKNPIKRANA